MLKSSLKTPEISQRKKVDVQGFQFPAMLPQSLCYGLETVTTSRLFFLPGCFPVLSAGLSLAYQPICKLDFSLTALIWPDLPLIKEQDFQLVYLKLLSLAPRVVTGMAANGNHSVSPGAGLPSEVLQLSVGRSWGWSLVLRCVWLLCYFNTLCSVLACFLLGFCWWKFLFYCSKSFAEVATSSHHLHTAFPPVSLSIQWEDGSTASCESVRRWPMHTVPKKAGSISGDWLPGGVSSYSSLRPVIDPEGICGFVVMVVWLWFCFTWQVSSDPWDSWSWKSKSRSIT